MMSSRRLVVSALADDDLRDLLQYSGETWGAEQRDAYATAMTEPMRQLAEFPEIDRARDDLAAGVRGDRVRRHTILYRSLRDTIRVLCIVHERRDTNVRVDY